MSADHEPNAEDLFAGFGNVNPSDEASARALRETRKALTAQPRTPLAQSRRRLIQCPSPSVAMILHAWAAVFHTVRSVAIGSASSQNPLPRRWITSARIAAVIFLLAAVIGGVYLVGGLTENHAFADVQRSLEGVKSITFTLRRTDGDRPEETAKVMLLGEDRARLELPSGEIVISDRSVGKTIRIVPEEEKGVWLSETSNDHEFIVKSIWRLRSVPIEDVIERGQDQEPGSPQAPIGPWWYEITMDDGLHTIVCVDPKTRLPCRILWGRLQGGHTPLFVIYGRDGTGWKWKPIDKVEGFPEVASDFVYNADLDPALFSLTQPVVSPVELRKPFSPDEIRRHSEEQ